MAVIQRPVKTYGTRSYVSEVAAAPGNQDPILSNEVDGDLDTIYSAWNAGVDAVNIKDGAVARAKLSATDVLPSLPPIPIATDANKTVVVNSAGNGLILGTGGTFVGLTPPATPQVGQLWWRSDPDGNLFIYYDDGNSKQFVPAVPSSVGPWSVSGSTVTPTDATKTVAIPATNGVAVGARTVKARLQSYANNDFGIFGVNRSIAAAGDTFTQDDPAKSSWQIVLESGAGDAMEVFRTPPGGVATALMRLDNTGILTIPSNATIGGYFSCPLNSIARFDGGASAAGVHFNYIWAPIDTAKCSWNIQLEESTQSIYFYFRARSAAAGSFSSKLQSTSAGDLIIAGSVGQKASGTTWANPSDPRLKQDLAPYIAGLAEIRALDPISYRLKAQPDGPVCYGFDAAKVRDVFPECVTTTRMKLDPADEDETDDVLVFDMHPILVALVNAVKELAGKVGA